MGSIRRQLKQQRPFATLEEEVFVGIELAADRLMAPWARHLGEEADLTHVQYNVLRILRGAGSAGLTVGAIAERLIARSPDATRLVDRLEKRGLVCREPDRDDRRVVRVGITTPGLERIAPLDGEVRALLRRTLGRVERSRLMLLRDVLAEVLDAVTEEARSVPPDPA